MSLPSWAYSHIHLEALWQPTLALRRMCPKVDFHCNPAMEVRHKPQVRKQDTWKRAAIVLVEISVINHANSNYRIDSFTRHERKWERFNKLVNFFQELLPKASELELSCKLSKWICQWIEVPASSCHLQPPTDNQQPAPNATWRHLSLGPLSSSTAYS